MLWPENGLDEFDEALPLYVFVASHFAGCCLIVLGHAQIMCADSELLFADEKLSSDFIDVEG